MRATRLTLAAALAEGDELCVCDLAWVAMYSLTPAGRELPAQTLAEEAPA